MKSFLGAIVLLFSSGSLLFLFHSQQGGLTPPDYFPQELYETSFATSQITALAPNLRRSILYGSGDREVTVRYGEQCVPHWCVCDRIETTSYQITSIASLEGGDELFVAGITGLNKDVIEKWSLPTREGGYYVRRTGGPALPIGTAMPTFAAEEFLNGTEFAAPVDVDYGPPDKNVLLDFTSFGHIRKLVADPEGRYLLVLTFPAQSIYRIRLLEQPIAVEPLFTSLQIPHLLQARTMQIFQLGGTRVCVLTEVEGSMSPVGAKRTILFDSNNDCQFESNATLDSNEWDAAGYSDPVVWQRHWNLGQTFDW